MSLKINQATKILRMIHMHTLLFPTHPQAQQTLDRREGGSLCKDTSSYHRRCCYGQPKAGSSTSCIPS